MLELKQTQKLSPILTQQLQQAIKLLQLSKLELVEAIEQEIKENPILEVGEEQAEEQTQETKDDGEEIAELLDRFSPSEEFSFREEKEYPDYENIIKKPSNLRDYLRWQAGLANFDQNERLVVEWIIENIDDNGYLAYPISEISKSSGFSSESLEEILKKVQKFDPSGVGARDLKECILIQYEALGEKDTLLEQILTSYFELFHHNNVKGIAKATGYPLDEVKKVFEKIKGFDPKPGRNYSDEYTSYIVPDVYVIKKEDGFEILLNDDDLPELRLNRYYMGLCRDKKTAGDTKKYIKNKLHQAEWFIKSIQQRQRTLYLVAESILTTNKYMSCPQGLYELKFFFPTGIDKDGDSPLSTNVVMDFIVEIVKHEDKKSPLTDSEIMDYLKAKQNINIARRTVAKYREGLNIPSSRDRTVQD